MRREMMQMIERELAEWNVGWRVDKRARGKRPRLILHHGGKSRFVVMPGSPSDKRGLLNKVRDIRVACEQLGARRQGDE